MNYIGEITGVIERIFEATNKGLDIICDFYPQAREVAGTKKKFRVRQEGDTNPSACLNLFPGVGGIEKWYLTDFGHPYYAKGRDALDVFMYEKGIGEKCEAVRLLCERYGIASDRVVEAATGKTKWLPALEGQQEGDFNYMKKRFTKQELAFLAPNGLTEEMCGELDYVSVEYVERVVRVGSDLKRVQTYSDVNYPIFVRCTVWETKEGERCESFKIYQPKSKEFKFSYAGKRLPADFINGEAALRRAYEQRGKKPLECAVIVSGERDAMCVKAFGYHPIWFNSETSGRNPVAIRRLYRYVKVLFHVPDIDETGLEAGRKLALDVMSVMTVDLPMKMLKRQGDQGKPMKDLRDWTELHRGKDEFEGLLNGACQLEFWKQEKGKALPCHRALKRFLRVVGGFEKIVGTTDSPSRLVRVDSHQVVEEVTVEQIRSWLTDVCPGQLGLPQTVREMLNNPRQLTNSMLENLEPFEGNFCSTGNDFQIHAFADSAYKVTKEGVTLLPERERPHIWRKQVADFHFRLLEPFFRYQVTVSCDGHLDASMELLNTDCNALRVLVNSSRTAWKEEVNYANATAEQLREWHRRPPRLDAPELKKELQREQMQCFINKIYCIGELMHRHRSPSRARAVMAIDYMVGDSSSQANGRGGKSFVFNRLLPMAGKSVQMIHARSVNETNWRFLFGKVTEETDVVLLEDCAQSVDFSWFYPNITQDMQVEAKGVQAHTIPFDVSPKLVFTTNYLPSTDDPSTRDRFIMTPFCDFYHADGNGYKERWSIKDDCGMDVGVADYPEEQRNRDVNFLLQCEQFYLHCVSLTDVPFTAPEGNLRKRRVQQQCGDNLSMYLEEYFASDSHFDRDINYNEFYEYFVDMMPPKYCPSKTFVVKNAKAYCAANDIVAFPPEMITDKVRGTIKRNNNLYFHFRRKKREEIGGCVA